MLPLHIRLAQTCIFHIEKWLHQQQQPLVPAVLLVIYSASILSLQPQLLTALHACFSCCARYHAFRWKPEFSICHCCLILSSLPVFSRSADIAFLPFSLCSSQLVCFSHLSIHRLFRDELLFQPSPRSLQFLPFSV